MQRLLFFILCILGFTQNQCYSSENIDDTLSINRLIKIGENYQSVNTDSAIIILKKTMTISNEKHYDSGYLRSGFSLANIYKQKGLFYESIKTIEYLMKFADTQKKTDVKAKCLYTLGEINRAAFYTDKALNYLFESLSIYSKSNNKLGQAKCYNRISAVYFEKKHMKKSEIYADSSNVIAKQLKQFSLISSNEELLGAVYRRNQKFPEAIKKLESALYWTSKSGDSTDIPNILNNFAYTYLEMKQFHKAIEYANQSFQISVKKDILTYTSNSAQILSDCYRAVNKLELAYNYLRFRDSLSFKSLMNDRNKIIMDLNEKYESGKKERQRLLLQQENNVKNITIGNQKKLFVISLFLLIIVSVSMLLIFLNRKKLAKANRLLAQQKEEISLQHYKISDAYQKLKEIETFKNDLTGMIVHDLKNPLNTIINPASYQSNAQKLESSRQAGFQMLNLVSNILDVQKYEYSKIILSKKNISLIQIIENSCEQVQALSDQKNIRIIADINPQIFLFADEDIMIRIFVNLLTNALKYSPDNSEIRIYNEIKSDTIFIHVEDQGDGIPQDKQNIVFDKFSQLITKKSGIARSTGLGLAFCKLAVEAHGGTIGVSGKLESGSIFTVCLHALIFENIKKDEAVEKDDNLKEFVFTDKEKNIINPIIQQLKTIEIFEASKIRTILNQISENNSPAISIWIQNINKAVYTGNMDNYNKWIQLE